MEKDKEIHSKNKVRVLIFIMALMIFFGAILTIIMLFQSCGANQNIYVKIAKTDVTKLQQIRLEGMYPGSKHEYTLNITAELPGTYKLGFDYEEIRDEGLKKYIYVEMIYEGVMLYQGNLSDLLGEKQISLETELNERNPIQIRIVYKMPKEVGNEAQGASMDFDIIISSEIQ